MKNIIIELQNSDTWKIQSKITINFIPSKDAGEDSVMHSRNDNIKFTSYDDGNEVVHELFESLCSRYQGNLETSMTGSDFIFDSVQLMYYKCHEVILEMVVHILILLTEEKRKKQQEIRKIKMINVFDLFGNGCITLWRN